MLFEKLGFGFSLCNGGKNVYQILTWCEGQEAKELLPSLSEEEQYKFGFEAGQMMLKMQTIESYPPSSNWSNIYNEKVKRYIKAYKSCGQTLIADEF